MLKGNDFILNAETVFKTGLASDSTSDIIATCLGATPAYAYDEKGMRTTVQKGWKYKVYVPNRDMTLSISVESGSCAIDTQSTGISQVNFVDFKATFYVDKKGYLALSAKAARAEKVLFDDDFA